MTFLALGAFALAAVATATQPALATSAPLPSFDFTQNATVAEWTALSDLARIEPTAAGMALHLNGPDPYCAGPGRDFPTDLPLNMKVRLKPSSSGMLQVFYFGRGLGPDEERSERVPAREAVWQDVVISLPPLGPGTHLRIDPPGTRGVCLIASISFESRPVIKAPSWPKPTLPAIDAKSPTLRSGTLTFRQDPAALGAFAIDVDGRRFATGHNRPLIGYLTPGGTAVQWIDVARTARVSSTVEPGGRGLTIRAELDDPDGGRWNLSQTFQAAPDPENAIRVTTSCAVTTPRDVVFLPLLLVLPGHGSFGPIKGQGLFAGVEYLENEPSSSTADLTRKAGANRLVPDSYRITFPLMAIQTHGHYLGLTWDRAPEICALFDSPDRTLGSTGHLLGLLAPGANGSNRGNGNLLPDRPLRLEPDRPVQVHAALLGGKGDSVVPTVQQYLARKGMPEIPTSLDLEGYLHLAAAGWLDSPIRHGHQFRHAVGGSFNAHPAADAAYRMEQLAALTRDAALSDRLRGEAAAAAALVPAEGLLHAAVGHVRQPVAALVLSDVSRGTTSVHPVDRSLEIATGSAREIIGRFQPDGSIRYQVGQGSRDTDYGKTHYCDEASGLTALSVHNLLEMAAYSGDRHAIDEGLRLLRILGRRFALGIPRGAQTWEIPLHTPDILASAHLVKAFALGFELTGEPALLEAARYWAWTGVPFVYLVNPTDAAGPGTVGPYATTPVLGATNWVAPNWIGLPVQWCGLVYADGLLDLARLDPGGPWRKLAHGIAASGILQSYPMEHPHRGLLPDSFVLTAQVRNPADINPGSLQPLALALLAGEHPAATAFQFRALHQSGILINAPGAVTVEDDQKGAARFTVRTWMPRPSYVVIHGIGDRPPAVECDGQAVTLDAPHRFLADQGTLILQLVGQKPHRLVISSAVPR